MIIGIIGAGSIGQAIAWRMLQVGIQPLLCNSRGPESLTDVLASLGTGATAGSIQDAIRPEIVVLAVPWSSVQHVLTDLPDFEGRILIDATNSIEPPYNRPADLGGRPSSQIVAELANGARLVKAFNTLRADHLRADPGHSAGRRVMFFSGDHAPSKAEVARLIDHLGFAGVDLGKLADGGRLQQHPGGPLASLNLIRLI